jgi:hypothetical protein
VSDGLICVRNVRSGADELLGVAYIERVEQLSTGVLVHLRSGDKIEVQGNLRMFSAFVSGWHR